MAFAMQDMPDLALYRKIKKLLWLRISRHLVCLCRPELSSGAVLPYHSAGQAYLPAVNNRFSKGHQGYLYELKMLACKRDTDYGDKEEHTKQDMRNSNPDTAENKPDDIQQNRKTAIAA